MQPWQAFYRMLTSFCFLHFTFCFFLVHILTILSLWIVFVLWVHGQSAVYWKKATALLFLQKISVFARLIIRQLYNKISVFSLLSVTIVLWVLKRSYLFCILAVCVLSHVTACVLCFRVASKWYLIKSGCCRFRYLDTFVIVVMLPSEEVSQPSVIQ